MIKFFGPGSEQKNEFYELKRQVNGYGKKPASCYISACGEYAYGSDPIRFHYSPGLVGQIKDLQAEVAKLKEIVREATDYIYREDK